MLLQRTHNAYATSRKNLVAIRRYDQPTSIDKDGNVVLPVWLVPMLKELGLKLIGLIGAFLAFDYIGRGFSKLPWREEEAAREYDQYMRSIYAQEFADSVANKVYLKVSDLQTKNGKIDQDTINMVMANAANYQTLRIAEQAMAESIMKADMVSVPSAIVAAISEPQDTDLDAARRLANLAISCRPTDPELASLMGDLAALLEMEGSQRFLAKCIVSDIMPKTGDAIGFGELYNEVVSAIGKSDPVRVRYLAIAEAITHSNL